MKLSDWAKKNGIAYKTAWRWFKNGTLPVPVKQISTGTILVEDASSSINDRNVIYCRVSNHSRKEELNYQVDRCQQFSLANGWSIHSVYKEVASGVNENRKEFWKAINCKPKRIIVEHKDRLSRFGFVYLEELLKQRGTEVVVINRDTVEENELIKDLVAIIYSFCARLYGLRKAYNKTKKCEKILEND